MSFWQWCMPHESSLITFRLTPLWFLPNFLCNHCFGELTTQGGLQNKERSWELLISSIYLALPLKARSLWTWWPSLLFFFVLLQSLIHYGCCPTHRNLVFSPLSKNSLYWALWALILLACGLRIQNLSLHLLFNITHSPRVEWASDTTNIIIKVLQTDVSLIKQEVIQTLIYYIV